jgi:hypothetical protein
VGGQVAHLAAIEGDADQSIDIRQLLVQSQNDQSPVLVLLGAQLRGTTRRWGGRRWCVLENNVSPSLEDTVRNVQLPVHGLQEGHLVLVDLVRVQAGNLTPGAGRVVTVLQVLGCQNKRGKEHAAAALKGLSRVAVVQLLHNEAPAGDMGLDENQVVQSHLQRGVTCPGAAQRLLNKGAQGEHGFASELAAADRRRRGPDGVHNQSRGINKAIDKVDLAIGLSNEGRGTGASVGTAYRGAAGVLAELGRYSRGGADSAKVLFAVLPGEGIRVARLVIRRVP